MKLKTLMKNYDGSLIIFYGNYKKDNRLNRIAQIGCIESNTEFYFEDKFETADECLATSRKMNESFNLNINKMYVNRDGKLVVYVK